MVKEGRVSELDQIMDDIDAPGASDDPLNEDGPEVNQQLPKRGRSKAKPVPQTAEQLEARIAELEAENKALARRASNAPIELPDNPEEEVTVTIPLTTTGFPITINGKKYAGKMTLKRRVLEQVLSMLGAHAQIQQELTHARGSEVRMGQLMDTDAVSRIKMRHRGERVVS